MPILRPRAGETPFEMGCNLLVPFSNRFSGGGFDFDGAFHEVAPMLEAEPLPIHGDGWLAAWTVAQRDGVRAVLRHEGACGPWRYEAEVTYEVGGGGIGMTLRIVNNGPRLPFGGAFHPWFPHDADTRVAFAADGVWTQDAHYLPDAHLDLAAHPEWSFANPRALPEGWINNGYTGWDGSARLLQPALGPEVTIRGDAPLNDLIVFSPSQAADFLCLEPVSHPVDAHNLQGQPGLAVLDRGETLALSCRISWPDLF